MTNPIVAEHPADIIRRDRLTAASFAVGWYEGKKGCRTLRGAMRKHPTLSPDAYLNGVDDGIRGDNFRLQRAIDILFR